MTNRSRNTGTQPENRTLARKAKNVRGEKSSFQVLVPNGFFHSIRGTLQTLFAANDGIVEDFWQFLENWEAQNPGSLFVDIDGQRANNTDRTDHSEAVSVSNDGAALLSAMTLVASAIERIKASHGEHLQNRHPEHNKANTRRAELLALVARETIENRSKRESYLPSELFGEPGWEMLLDLAIHYKSGSWISAKSLCIASGAPNTTALRYIRILEDHGLVRSKKHPSDKRAKLHILSSKGYEQISKLLADVHGL